MKYSVNGVVCGINVPISTCLVNSESEKTRKSYDKGSPFGSVELLTARTWNEPITVSPSTGVRGTGTVGGILDDAVTRNEAIFIQLDQACPSKALTRHLYLKLYINWIGTVQLVLPPDPCEIIVD